MQIQIVSHKVTKGHYLYSRYRLEGGDTRRTRHDAICL